MARWIVSTDCTSVEGLAAAYVDRRLRVDECARLERHLGKCLDCSARMDQYLQIRDRLRALPPIQVPEDLNLQLRVLASREHARRAEGTSALALLVTRLRLAVDNLMRPLALPFVGALASAVFMFGTLVPNLYFPREVSTHDVATPLYQEAGVDNVPEFVTKTGAADDNLLIEVSIDQQGRVYDFSVPEGKMTSELANEMLFSTYTPARVFGQPMQGKVLLRRSRIVVKG